MYDTITPEQWIYGLLASLIAFAILWWLFYHYTRPRDETPSHMSSSSTAPVAGAGMEPVCIPVSQTGMARHTSAPPPAGMDAAADRAPPDIDAANGGMGDDDWVPPRISTHLSDAETIALLAVQRRADGKHRYSANAIHALVGGDRNTVMARVKELRAGAPAVFQPLTEAQVAAREALGLDRA